MSHADIIDHRPVVLVTGANSLLGTNVIERLLGQDYKVRGLLRDKTRFYLPPHPDLSLIEGDFTDPEILWNALQGCDYVIHVAACTDQGVSDYEHYRKINVDATHQLFMFAVKTGVRRLVYVSTANCFGFGTKADPGDETCPACAPFTGSLYARSKQEAQELLLRLRHLMDVVIVNPTFMLGPYDSKPSSGQIVLMGYRKKVIFCPPGGKNFIHVGDAAKGAVAALRSGRSGEAYLLSGENLTYREFFGKLAAVTDHNPMYITLPRFVLLAVGHLGNFLQKVGIANRFTLPNMKILCIGNYYSNHKAVTELGLDALPIGQGISDTIDWFKTRGIIKNK